MIGISCRRAAELLSRSREDSLGGLNRLSLSVHLALCTNCRAYSQQLHWIDQAMGNAYRDVPARLEDAARLRIARVLSQVGGPPPSGEE